jgi:Fe2+ or Zn2+ uptake regulation protein
MLQGKCTTQKQAIAAVLCETLDHPSAAVIFERVRERLPKISLATVYRNLEAMVAAGSVRAISGAPECRFDANTMPHHHFLCQECHSLRDVPSTDAGVSLTYPDSIEDCTVTGVQLLLSGYCPACRPD